MGFRTGKQPMHSGISVCLVNERQIAESLIESAQFWKSEGGGRIQEKIADTYARPHQYR
jgi:hypothetical protein